MTKSDSGEDLFRLIFNAVPLPLFRVSRQVEILDLNRAAQKIFNTPPAQALKKRGGDVMRCINAVGIPGGCGNATPCLDCEIRNSVRLVFETGQEITRHRAVSEVLMGEQLTNLELLITVTPIHYAGEMSALLCLEDISELNSLRSMIPICSSCKKIRDDQELWSSVESYFARFLGIGFSHGICPDCAHRLYPELFEKWNKPERS